MGLAAIDLEEKVRRRKGLEMQRIWKEEVNKELHLGRFFSSKFFQKNVLQLTVFGQLKSTQSCLEQDKHPLINSKAVFIKSSMSSHQISPSRSSHSSSRLTTQFSPISWHTWTLAAAWRRRTLWQRTRPQLEGRRRSACEEQAASAR